MTDAAATPEPHLRQRRWPFAVLLLGSFLWLGLVIGAAVGARWLVPEGSGLAGSAIVLGYGRIPLDAVSHGRAECQV